MVSWCSWLDGLVFSLVYKFEEGFRYQLKSIAILSFRIDEIDLCTLLVTRVIEKVIFPLVTCVGIPITLVGCLYHLVAWLYNEV